MILPYWIEHDNNNNPKDYLWVKIDRLLPNKSRTFFIRKEQGFNPDGNAVFDFFEDFETLDTSKWNVLGSPTVNNSEITIIGTQSSPNLSVQVSTKKTWLLGDLKQNKYNFVLYQTYFYKTGDAQSILLSNPTFQLHPYYSGQNPSFGLYQEANGSKDLTIIKYPTYSYGYNTYNYFPRKIHFYFNSSKYYIKQTNPSQPEKILSFSHITSDNTTPLRISLQSALAEQRFDYIYVYKPFDLTRFLIKIDIINNETLQVQIDNVSGEEITDQEISIQLSDLPEGFITSQNESLLVYKNEIDLKINYNISYSSDKQIRIVFSNDKGQTWLGYDMETKQWIPIDLNSNSQIVNYGLKYLGSGYTINNIHEYDPEIWNKLIFETHNLMIKIIYRYISYNQEITFKNFTLKYDFDGKWVLQTPVEDYEYEIVDNILRVIFKKSGDYKVLYNVIDIQPPKDLISFTQENQGYGKVLLRWIKSPDYDYSAVKILRKTDGFPTNENDGLLVYDGTGNEVLDTNLIPNTTYYYTQFPYDIRSPQNVNRSVSEFNRLTYTPEELKIYGVEWDTSIQDTQLTRIGDQNGIQQGKEFPKYYQDGNYRIVSPFDNIYPWSQIKKCLLDKDGNVVYYEDDFLYDESLGYDVMVEIPKFYYKYEEEGAIKRWYISNGQYDPSFQIHPQFIKKDNDGNEIIQDKIYVSQYLQGLENNELVSKPNIQPYYIQDESDLNLQSNKGSNWKNLDFMAVSQLQLLYLVEFQDWDFRNILGYEADETLINEQMDSSQTTIGDILDAINGKYQYRGVQGFNLLSLNTVIDDVRANLNTSFLFVVNKTSTYYASNLPVTAGYGSDILNGKLYLVAGDNGTNVYNTVFSSFDGQTWTQEPNGPFSQRSRLSVKTFDNKLWVMGGSTSLNIYNSSYFKNDIWYTTNGTTWTLLTSSQIWIPRTLFNVSIFNNQLVLSGGWTGGQYVNDIWTSTNGITWTLKTSQQQWEVRGIHATSEFKTKFYLIGGYNGVYSLKDIWMTSDLITWTKVGDFQGNAKRNHLFVNYNDLFLILGFGDGAYGLLSTDLWVSIDGKNYTQVQNISAQTDNGYLRSYIFDGINKIIYVLGNGTTPFKVFKIKFNFKFNFSNFIFEINPYLYQKLYENLLNPTNELQLQGFIKDFPSGSQYFIPNDINGSQTTYTTISFIINSLNSSFFLIHTNEGYELNDQIASKFLRLEFFKTSQ